MPGAPVVTASGRKSKKRMVADADDLGGDYPRQPKRSKSVGGKATA